MRAHGLPSQEYLQSVLDYDPATGIFRWKDRTDIPRKDNTRLSGKVAGGHKGGGYQRIRLNYKPYLSHRIAWKIMFNEEPTEIDHKNLDPSDNRIENLRAATISQNRANRPAKKSNTSGFKGVTKCGKGWKSLIKCDGVQFYLGHFQTAEEAGEAYRIASVEKFGVFSRV